MSYGPAVSFNIWDAFWADKLDGLIRVVKMAYPGYTKIVKIMRFSLKSGIIFENRKIFNILAYPGYAIFLTLGLIMNEIVAGPEPEPEEKEMSLPQQTDFYCRTCDLKLNSRVHQVAHYKSDQHRRKIKSKLRSKNESESDSR